MHYPENGSLHSSDKPREHYRDDLLGHSYFAQRLAKSIMSIPSKDGITFGLFGKWGTGKTTLLNFVQCFLRELPAAEQPVFVVFNPWWLPGESEVTIRFFETLLASLVKSGLEPRAVKALKDIADFFSDLPSGIGWVGKIGSRMLGRLQDRDVLKLRDRAALALKAQSRRILILIDDVDRLLPTEMLTVLKIAKIIGDLPNVVCVLSMDKEIVIAGITQAISSGAYRALFDDLQLGPSVSGLLNLRQETLVATEYLEKIVKVPLDLPSPDPDAIQALFIDAIRDILGDDGDSMDFEYFRHVYLSGLELLFATPRKLVRFRNSAVATYAAVKGEVNCTDFLALEGIRIACPEAYQMIRDNGQYFYGSGTFDKLEQFPQKETKDFHDAWLAGLAPKDRRPIERILQSIFPRMEKAVTGSNRIMGGKPRDKMLLARLEDKFPIYFSYTVPARDISNLEIVTIIKSDKSAIKASLKALTSERRPNGSTKLLALLEKFDDYLPSIAEDSLAKLICAFLEVGDELIKSNDFGKGFLGLPMGNSLRISGILQRLLKRLKKSQAYDLLLKSGNEGADLGTLVYLVALIDDDSKQVSRREKENDDTLSFDENQMKALREMCVSRISAASKEELLQNPNLRYIFAAWATWRPETLKVWADKNLKSSEDILFLLAKIEANLSVDWNTLDLMLGLNELELRLNASKSDSDEWRLSRSYLDKCVAAKRISMAANVKDAPLD